MQRVKKKHRSTKCARENNDKVEKDHSVKMLASLQVDTQKQILVTLHEAATVPSNRNRIPFTFPLNSYLRRNNSVWMHSDWMENQTKLIIENAMHVKYCHKLSIISISFFFRFVLHWFGIFGLGMYFMPLKSRASPLIKQHTHSLSTIITHNKCERSIIFFWLLLLLLFVIVFAWKLTASFFFVDTHIKNS